MNIFVTSPSPHLSAQVLPDKHIVKMPLECCQMLSIVASDKLGHGYGELHRTNGEPYKTEKGAFLSIELLEKSSYELKGSLQREGGAGDSPGGRLRSILYPAPPKRCSCVGSITIS